MRLTKQLNRVRKVVCGMSGGVDSAVTALILKTKGYDVHGLFMKNWDSTNEHGVCMADVDREDAKFVCDQLNIPFHEVNFVKEYWNDVFSAFLKELSTGRTPNPDVLCNKFIKFDAFFKYATQTMGADAIATGHYVRSSAGYDLDNIDPVAGVNLLKAADQSKCQTLFLSQISQDALRRALFPVGELLKCEVKAVARQCGLNRIADRKESMGICFIGKRHFQDFIEDYMEPKPGLFVDLETGKVLGEHKGVHNFTIGQRALLSGMKAAMYIAEKDLHTNELKLVQGGDHPALYSQTLFTEEVSWINKPPRELMTNQMMDCEMRYQHIRMRKIMCTLTLSGGNSVIVSLDQPIKAVARGQYAVFYDGDVCLGSGKIRKVGPSMYTMNKIDKVGDHCDRELTNENGDNVQCTR